MLIDSHCHLHDHEFFTEEQAAAALKNAKDAGVEKIICIGTDQDDSIAARDFAEGKENVFWTYGVHPENAGKSDGNHFLETSRSLARASSTSASAALKKSRSCKWQ